MRPKIIDLASSLHSSRMAAIGAALILTFTTSGWAQTSVVVGSAATATATSTGPSTLPLGLIFLGSQNQDDPAGMYGHCGGVNSGIQSKASTILGGTNLNKVAAIRVLDCHQFDGGGGSSTVPCPAGTTPAPTYCVLVQNDGIGNHVLLGVYINVNSLPCELTGKNSGPPAQITITLRDNAFGIRTVELRGGVSNATTQFFVGPTNGPDNREVVLSATKIDQSAPASLSNILVTNVRGTTTTCSFSF